MYPPPLVNVLMIIDLPNNTKYVSLRHNVMDALVGLSPTRASTTIYRKETYLYCGAGLSLKGGR